jgi:hypothetical protein
VARAYESASNLLREKDGENVSFYQMIWHMMKNGFTEEDAVHASGILISYGALNEEAGSGLMSLPNLA